MAVINGVFCLDSCVTYKRETLSVVTFEWSEIMGTYNTSDTSAGIRTKYRVMIR